MEFILNKEQVRAIEYESKTNNLIVFAGPGTGKTTVIIKRIEYLVEKRGVSMNRIMVTSYTNSAIQTIKNQFQQHINLDFDIEYSGTMHYVAKKILNQFSDDLISISNNLFTFSSIIFLQNDSIFQQIIYQATGKESLKNKELEKIKKIVDEYISFVRLHGYIDWLEKNPGEKGWKIYWNNHQHHFAHPKTWELPTNTIDFEQLKKIFDIVHGRTIDSQQMFCTDVLIWFHQLLIHSAAAKDWVNKHFSHILVDELQDMNEIQLEILKEMSGDNYNLFCVGDPNQSIYSFQGANYKKLKNFIDDKDLKNLEISLIKNYRNSSNIIDFSQRIIYPHKKHKTIQNFETNDSNPYIYFYEGENTETSSKLLLKKIKDLKGSDIPLKDIVVLFSHIWVDINVEQIMFDSATKFINYSNIKLFDDEDIKVLICCVNLILKPNSLCVKCLLMIWRSQQKINPSTFQAIQHESKKYGGCWYSALINMETGGILDGCIMSIKQLKMFVLYMEELNHEFNDFFMTKYSPKSKTSWQEREFIMTTAESLHKKIQKKFKSFWDEYEKTFELSLRHDQVIKILDFLFNSCENVESLYGHALDYVKVFFNSQDRDVINISNIHGVKGFSFEHVFLVGVTEGMLPHYKAKWSPGSIEEERRKIYVAITRAKKNLYLFHTQNPTFKNGESSPRWPSSLVSKLLNIKLPYLKHVRIKAKITK